MVSKQARAWRAQAEARATREAEARGIAELRAAETARALAEAEGELQACKLAADAACREEAERIAEAQVRSVCI